MSITIHTVVLYKNITNVVGYPSSNDVDLLNFETTYKSQATKISDLVISDTAFELLETYTIFKTLITIPIVWSDVKYIEKGNSYLLYLLI